MRDETKNGPYDVGYGKPPEHAQFKKGKSGNLKGRPKGTLNLATVLDRTLREQVVSQAAPAETQQPFAPIAYGLPSS